MGRNALEDLSMANLAAISRGERVSGIDDSEIGAVDDSEFEDDSVDGIDDSELEDSVGAAKPKKKPIRRGRPWLGRKILPIGSFSIPAGGTQLFDVSPLAEFLAQRLVMIGAGTVIQSLDVQGDNQMLANLSCPVDMFAGAGADLNFRFKVCPVNGHISVLVQNPTVAAVVVTGGFLGLYR